MKIGMIGAGKIGGTLTRRFTALGHSVAVANSRGPATLGELCAETGAMAVTAEDAAKGRDLVVFTVPMRDVPSLKAVFAAAAPGTVVVDTCNYYPRQRDGRIEAIESGMTEARWVSTQIGRPTVKAFNSINWLKILNNGKPEGDPARFAIAVASDDAAAKAKVMALIDEIGFDAVDDGGLDDSWRQQPGTPAYGTDLPKEKLVAALAAANPGRPEDFTGRPGDPQPRS